MDKDEKLVPINVMVPRWVKRELEEQAWQQRWHFSDIVRHALAAYLTPVRVTQPAEPQQEAK